LSVPIFSPHRHLALRLSRFTTTRSSGGPTKGEKDMRSSNPVLGRAFNQRGYAAFDPSTINSDPAALENLYNSPAASSLRTGRMTIDDVVTRTAILFAVLVTVGAAAWTLNLGGGALMLGFIGGLVLAMVNIFSKTVKPALVIAYAAFQGLALGTLSNMYNTVYDGIVSQAILVTISAFAAMLFAYKSGRIRVTPKFTKVLMTALLGYFVLAMVSLVGSFFGASLYSIGGFGLILAAGGMVLASFFLILDFDQIQNSINAGVPQSESWRAAFGLMVTIVWLYMEVLRLLSILRGND
jgi:uncharacterized YccA/Bax inhibitor family protein